jgi:uncharacterized membrane protein
VAHAPAPGARGSSVRGALTGGVRSLVTRSSFIVENAIVAAVYAAIALALPATAVANYRLTTALYVLASFDRRLIVGLALGNALAGIPQGPVDIGLGFGIGVLTAGACAFVPRVLTPLAVFVLPTVFVPLWLSLLFHAPYRVVLPVVATGQALSAILAWILVIPAGRRIFAARLQRQAAVKD